LIAHGSDKTQIASKSKAAEVEQRVIAALRAKSSLPEPENGIDSRGRRVLAVGALMSKPDWSVIVEQPRSDALRLASQLEMQLVGIIGLALLAAIIGGWIWGRAFIRR